MTAKPGEAETVNVPPVTRLSGVSSLERMKNFWHERGEGNDFSAGPVGKSRNVTTSLLSIA